MTCAPAKGSDFPFRPDLGEDDPPLDDAPHAKLIAHPAPGAPVPPILPAQNGFLMLDKAKFHESFAADVDPAKTAFMADSQIPWGLSALNGEANAPAWKRKPSWYLVATDDRMIPPNAQRLMSKRAGAAVVEVEGSHAVYVSQPGAVAELIETAAETVKVAGK